MDQEQRFGIDPTKYSINWANQLMTGTWADFLRMLDKMSKWEAVDFDRTVLRAAPPSMSVGDYVMDVGMLGIAGLEIGSVVSGNAEAMSGLARHIVERLQEVRIRQEGGDFQ